MRRPMFQTPQQRAGGGIMRGVAPVQGYQEGGEINPFGMTESSAGQPVPNDIFAEDFWTTETTEEGSGITSRDVFNFLIANPDDPTDVAIAAAMAPLWIFPPAAIAARLARMGYKGLKVTKALEKVADVQNKIPKAYGLLGSGTGRRSGLAQANIAREVPTIGREASDVYKAFGEEVEEGSREGIASLPQTEEVEETEEVSSQGIASLPKDSGRFGEGDSKVRNNLANVSKEQLDAYGGSLTEYMNEWNRTGNRPTTLRKQQEPVEMWGGGLAIARLLGRLRGKGKKGGAVDDVVDETVESVAAPPNPPATIGSKILKAAGIGGGLGVGTTLGLSALPGDDDEESLISKEDAEALSNEPTIEPTIEVAQEQIQEEPGGVRGFVGNLVDKLSDPRLQYQLAKAAQPSEGFVPRNFFSDVTLAGQEYDQLQAELDAKKPELVQQYEAIRPYAERGPNETEEDVDRRVLKSLFDRMNASAQLEALLTLYKSVPDAATNLEAFEDFARNLGLGAVSDVLTKKADKQ